MRRKNSLVRDLIDTGIFTVLYILVAAFGMIGILGGPWGLYLSLLGSALVGGIVILPYFSRISTAQVFVILGVVVGLSTVSHGWPSGITPILFSFLGSLLLRQDKVASRITWRSELAYAVFTLWYIGPLAPMILTRQAYFAQRAAQRGAESTDLLAQVFSPTMIAIFMCLTFILAWIGAFLGRKLVTTYFKTAGLA